MNTRLLLRRPKCVIKDFVIDSSSPPKSSELRTTSFKEEIQPEIELLDREYLSNKNNQQLEIESFDQDNNTYKPEFGIKPKRDNKCSVVSVWSIDDGLLPAKDKEKKTIVDKSCEVHVSAKTVRNFDKDNHISQNTIQPEIYCHNLYEQTESFLPTPNKAVPRHIIIIQIAALLKRQVSDDMNKDVGCTILSVPKRPGNNFQIVPKFEIVLYENDKFKNKGSIKSYEISEILQQKLVNTEQGGDYRQTEDESDNDISAIDVSMMECHMTGKHHLNFNGHSIFEIPNLKSIFPNLTAIDLSYNNFKVIPAEVIELTLLEELNLRNNPIQMIPDNINAMNNLRVLICSFGRLSILPASLFSCPNLLEMDLSYNMINCVPHITAPYKLKTLNISGNPIRYFKKSVGSLHLDKISLVDTWTNPVFWTNGEFTPSILDQSWDFCDLCDQHLSDFSLSTITFSRKFGHVIPILLSFCSSLCKNTLIPEMCDNINN